MKLIQFILYGVGFTIIAGLINRYLLNYYLPTNMVGVISLLLAAIYVLFKKEAVPKSTKEPESK